MEKNQKKYLSKKLKEAVLVASSIFTGVTMSACDEEQKTDVGTNVEIDVQNPSNSSHVDDVTDVQTSNVESEEDSTTYETTLNVDDEDNTYTIVEEHIINYENDTEKVTESSTSSTTTKTKSDNSSLVDDHGVEPIVTKATTKSNTVKTTASTKNTKPTTKTTTKVTTKATKPTTAKTTTTVTTTTTEAVTEPPATEPVVDYNINDICYNADAFNIYADKLNLDIKRSNDGTIYHYFDMPYGRTVLEDESKYLLALLNYGSISDEVLISIFGEYSTDDILHFDEFVNYLATYERNCNSNVNFANYVCDTCLDVGYYFNEMQAKLLDGSYADFAVDQFVNGNVDPKYYNSIPIRYYHVSCSYAYELPVSDEFGFSKSEFYDNLYLVSHGYSKSY